MTDLPLYQVVDWDEHFENFRARTIDRCQYLNIPNKQGGSGWCNVMSEADGMAVYGVWVSILQVLSRQRRHEVAGGKLLREGYLTDNGKKDGRRLSALELSNQFRRPIGEIHRCTQVVTDVRVGWLRLVEGCPEYAQTMPEGYQKEHRQPIAPPSPDHRPTISRADVDRLIDRESTLSAVPEQPEKADNPQMPAGYPVDAAPIPDRCSDDTGVAVSGDQPQDVVQHAEAKLILGKLCRDVFPDEATRVRATIWPNDWEHWLDEALPISRDSLELVDWAYRLPDDDRLFEVTMKRHTFGAIIENLPGEVSKIRSARKKLGLNGLTPDGTVRVAEDWTPARKKAALELYGAERPLPDRFSQMASSARAEIENRVREEATA